MPGTIHIEGIAAAAAYCEGFPAFVLFFFQVFFLVFLLFALRWLVGMGIDAVLRLFPCFEKQLASEDEVFGFLAVVHEAHLAEGLVYLTPITIVVVHDGVTLRGLHFPAVIQFLAVLINAGVDVAVQGYEIKLVASLLGDVGLAVAVARTENGQFCVGELAGLSANDTALLGGFHLGQFGTVSGLLLFLVHGDMASTANELDGFLELDALAFHDEVDHIAGFVVAAAVVFDEPFPALEEDAGRWMVVVIAHLHEVGRLARVEVGEVELEEVGASVSGII